MSNINWEAVAFLFAWIGAIVGVASLFVAYKLRGA